MSTRSRETNLAANPKWRIIAAFVSLAAIMLPAVQAGTRKGEKLLKEGQKAELANDYDGALSYFEKALEEDPRDAAYLLAAQVAKTKASEYHLSAGRILLAEKKVGEALAAFQRAALLDPSSLIALQMMTEASVMVKARSKGQEEAFVTSAERSSQEAERRVGSLQGAPKLRPINNMISNFKMHDQSAGVLYESIGKLSGINVIFDPAGLSIAGNGGARRFNIDLNDSSLEEALRYIALLTHTFWKPLSRNAIFVTQESEQKLQEYQDEVLQAFQISNSTSVSELTEILNAVRMGTKLNSVVQVPARNVIMVRGPVDAVALSEKIIHDLDQPKAEVQIDLVVLEVSKDRVANLGMALQGANILSVSPMTTTNGSVDGTAAAGASIPLSRLGKVSSNDYAVTLPSAVAQALMTDSSSRELQRPQVRVTDGGKGTLRIGSKIPYVSGSLNSAVAAAGSIPYATTQFQQIEVGVNIDVSPHVNGPDDISMHIRVEVSNVTSTVTIAGVAQPVIGQKVTEADIRMRVGECSILGGLSSDSNSLSISGLPGLSNLPILGYAFGTRDKEKHKGDLLIGLVPHIIGRSPANVQSSDGVLAGTERSVQVRRKLEETREPGGQSDLLPSTNNPHTRLVAEDLHRPDATVAPRAAAGSQGRQLSYSEQPRLEPLIMSAAPPKKPEDYEQGAARRSTAPQTLNDRPAKPPSSFSLKPQVGGASREWPSPLRKPLPFCTGGSARYHRDHSGSNTIVQQPSPSAADVSKEAGGDATSNIVCNKEMPSSP